MLDSSQITVFCTHSKSLKGVIQSNMNKGTHDHFYCLVSYVWCTPNISVTFLDCIKSLFLFALW